MFCKNCGTQLSDDSKVCSNCGYKTEDANSNESIESIEIDNSQVETESDTTNKKRTKKVFISLTIVLLVLCVAFSAWGFIEYANEQDSGSSYGDGSYNGNYNDNYSSGIDKSIGLSLKVDSIKTSGSYTYVYCTVTNVSSKYLATRYRYVKVKAQFKNYSGSIVDTDWTYAVDSTWLEPGESKTFYYMVKNTNIKSATLSFVD